MDPSPEQIIALSARLNDIAKNLASAQDPSAKKDQTQRLVMQAKQLIEQVQDPFEALSDHIVNGYTISACLASQQLGLFEAVPPTGTVTAEEIARRCDAPEELIVRIMRQLTCVNIFNEVRIGEWAHNRLSIVHSGHAGVMSGKWLYQVGLDEMASCMYHLNHYLKRFGNYSILSTYTETPHSWFNNMLGKNFWEVLNSSPERIGNFIRGLGTWEPMHPVVAMFPFEEILQQGNAPDRPLMVDIGGGRGLALLAMRKECPTLQGELILQDRPYVLNDINPEDLPGVRKMAHDFFEEQPVKNAQMYYLRRVLHDWQDAEAIKILKAIVPAMATDSRIIISDMALPEPVTARDAHAIWLDLMMMSIGGKERTERDWEKLAEPSGLKLVRVWQQPERFGPLCVVEYMLPDARCEKIGTIGLIDGTAEADSDLIMVKSTHVDEGSTTTSSVAVATPTSIDWEEGTIVADREQSIEPNHG